MGRLSAAGFCLWRDKAAPQCCWPSSVDICVHSSTRDMLGTQDSLVSLHGCRVYTLEASGRIEGLGEGLSQKRTRDYLSLSRDGVTVTRDGSYPRDWGKLFLFLKCTGGTGLLWIGSAD